MRLIWLGGVLDGGESVYPLNIIMEEGQQAKWQKLEDKFLWSCCSGCQVPKPFNQYSKNQPSKGDCCYPALAKSPHGLHCIGPWQVPLPGKGKVSISALASIDPATNWLEINRLLDKTSAKVAATFKNNWLARYPRPQRCVHDRR